MINSLYVHVHHLQKIQSKGLKLIEQNIDLYVGFFYYIKNLDLTINF
jgi:hypothetical protein